MFKMSAECQIFKETIAQKVILLCFIVKQFLEISKTMYQWLSFTWANTTKAAERKCGARGKLPPPLYADLNITDPSLDNFLPPLDTLSDNP